MEQYAANSNSSAEQIVVQAGQIQQQVWITPDSPPLGASPLVAVGSRLLARIWIGVAFQAPPGSQASSRGEAKDSALLSSRDASEAPWEVP